jgi:hypothetical protein
LKQASLKGFTSAYELKEERLFIINRPTQITDYEFRNEKKKPQNNKQ